MRTGDIAAQQLDAQRAALAQAQSQYRSALDNVAAAQTGVTQAQARYTSAIASTSAASAGIGAQQGQLADRARPAQRERQPVPRLRPRRRKPTRRSRRPARCRRRSKAAQDRLGYTVIRSPIDGIVGAKNVEVGTSVAPGQSLMTLVPDARHLHHRQLQRDAARQRQDRPARRRQGRRVQGHRRSSGRVAAIAPASQNTFSLVPAQNATGNFVKVTQRIPVRIVVVDPPPDKPLRVGMSVETSIKVK